MTVSASSLTALTASSARPSLGRSLLAGPGSGVFGALAASTAWLLLGANPGMPTAPLGPVAIFAATVVLNLLGSVVFFGLARRMARPANSFRILGLGFATLYSAALFPNPETAPIAATATVLHYVAASVALVAIPRLARPHR